MIGLMKWREKDFIRMIRFPNFHQRTEIQIGCDFRDFALSSLWDRISEDDPVSNYLFMIFSAIWNGLYTDFCLWKDICILKCKFKQKRERERDVSCLV